MLVFIHTFSSVVAYIRCLCRARAPRTFIEHVKLFSLRLHLYVHHPLILLYFYLNEKQDFLKESLIFYSTYLTLLFTTFEVLSVTHIHRNIWLNKRHTLVICSYKVHQLSFRLYFFFFSMNGFYFH